MTHGPTRRLGGGSRVVEVPTNSKYRAVLPPKPLAKRTGGLRTAAADGQSNAARPDISAALRGETHAVHRGLCARARRGSAAAE